MTSEVNVINQIENQGIFVQTEELNYVIEGNGSVYSFAGRVGQVNEKFANFEDRFKSFYFSRKKAIDGMNVEGSTLEHQFWIVEKEDGKVYLIHNGNTIDILEQKPRRAWVHMKTEGVYLFVFQLPSLQNQLIFSEKVVDTFVDL